MSAVAGQRYLGETLLSDLNDWTRPADWLPIPEYEPTDEVAYFLLAIVDDDNCNYFAGVFAGNYTVDWGDGTTSDHAANTKAQHHYTYASISSPTFALDVANPTAKQVLIKVTTQVGFSLTRIDTSYKHDAVSGSHDFNVMLMDAVVNAPNATNISPASGNVHMQLCQRYKITACGNLPTLYFGRLNLNKFEMTVPLPASVTSLASVLANYQGLAEDLPNFNTQNVTNFFGVFNACGRMSFIPNWDFSNGTNFDGAFNAMWSLESVDIDMADATTMASAFAACKLLSYVSLRNTGKVTNFNTLFSSDRSLMEVGALDMTSATTAVNMFLGCLSLRRSQAFGCKITHSYANCFLSRDAIVEIFTNLGVAAGAQTITVTGNWGVADLSAPDIAIATDKGWTVAL